MLKVLLFFSVLMPSFTALAMDKAIEVSFFQLINDPESYSDKRITLIGYLTRLDESCGIVAYDGIAHRVGKNYELVRFCLKEKLRNKYPKLTSDIISVTGFFYNNESECVDLIKYGRGKRYLGCLKNVDYLFDIHPDVDPGPIPAPKKSNGGV